MRVFSRFPVLTLVLLLTPFVGGCTPDQIADTESLERDLMLTWVALERNEPERAAAFNAEVQNGWDLARAKYITNATPILRASAERAAVWLRNLDEAVQQGDRQRAITAIHLIQNELRALRPQADHPANQLYEFHQLWREVVATSNDPMLCLLEWGEFEAQYASAARSWQKFGATQPRQHGSLFPGYGNSAQMVEAAGLELESSIESYAELLEQADRSLAAAPSRRVDDLFIDFIAVIAAYPGATTGENVQ